MAEFLPLCDVLFNVISLAGYFCDVVFDVVMGYALLERGFKGTFAATISIVVTSLIISQILSLRWYLHVCEGTEGRKIWMPILLHCLQLGVLWRYAKLFVPVDLRNIKHEVRDLCMLRLVHAFCEAAPMLLLQLHILFRDNEDSDTSDMVQRESIDEPTANKTFAELNVISASLSLFSVCWALASFSKNVRLQNVHRLVLTWLGVIFQFLWRLGTITARMCALTLYALVYRYWVFLVIGLHWVSMFLWLISPKNVFHGERISKPRKAYLSALIAFVYVFAYINLQELNHRQKMITFYCVMLIENCLLVGAWAAGHSGGRHSPAVVAPSMLASFLTGLAFMLIYYRYFHVRRLGYILGEQQGTNSTNNSGQSKNGKQSIPADNAAIPGVFNCRFTSPVISNGTNARKKKKPTSFVPPPAASAAAPAPNAAFWRKPLPHHHHGGSSENEGSSVGSRVNIQQKLQEKKQKQLAELRVIEEEIKQGKLAKTAPAAPDEIYSSLQRQPIPRAKTHADTPAWPKTHTHAYQNYPILAHNCGSYPAYTEIKKFNSENFQETNESAQNIEARICTSQVQRPAQNRLYGQESRTFYENPTNLCPEISRNQLRTPNYIGISESRIYEDNATNPRNVHNGSPRTYAADVSSAGNSYERPRNSPLNKPRNTNYDEHPRKSLDYTYCDNTDQNIYNKYGTEKFEYISALQNALNAVQNLDVRNNYNEVHYGQDTRLEFCYPGLPAKKLEPTTRKLQRCRTPEILLAPRYLEGCSRPVCCHWGPHYVRKKEECCVSAGGGGGGGGEGASSGSESGAEPRDTPRPPSDIDSQISLPRSYTLPREFRYWRRRRPPHAPPAHNNSSDGDVDSADDGAGGGGGRADRDEPPAERRVRRLAHRKPAKPETKL